MSAQVTSNHVYSGGVKYTEMIAWDRVQINPPLYEIAPAQGLGNVVAREVDLLTRLEDYRIPGIGAR